MSNDSFLEVRQLQSEIAEPNNRLFAELDSIDITLDGNQVPRRLTVSIWKKKNDNIELEIYEFSDEFIKTKLQRITRKISFELFIGVSDIKQFVSNKT